MKMGNGILVTWSKKRRASHEQQPCLPRVRANAAQPCLPLLNGFPHTFVFSPLLAGKKTKVKTFLCPRQALFHGQGKRGLL